MCPQNTEKSLKLTQMEMEINVIYAQIIPCFLRIKSEKYWKQKKACLVRCVKAVLKKSTPEMKNCTFIKLGDTKNTKDRCKSQSKL